MCPLWSEGGGRRDHAKQDKLPNHSLTQTLKIHEELFVPKTVPKEIVRMCRKTPCEYGEMPKR